MENGSGCASADISLYGEKWALPCRPEPRDGTSDSAFDILRNALGGHQSSYLRGCPGDSAHDRSRLRRSQDSQGVCDAS
eukprot:scaffold3083_cov440-Prasinococcus_capsulatus_cf.AAC.4